MGHFIIRLGLILSFMLFGASCSQDFAFSDKDPEAASSFGSETHVWNLGVQKVDILFVVDNSTSMAAEQKKMADRIGSFLSKLNDVDWQLGITTTDVSNGKYGIKGSLLRIGHQGEYFIGSETSNPEALFRKHIQREESTSCGFDCPSPTEQPLMATIMAASKHDSDNSGFFREGALLAVVVISDEDEKSSGPSSATKPSEVVAAVKNYLGSNKNVTGYGIVIQPWDRECFESQKENSLAHYGEFVQNFADLTGGLTGSICDSDYSENLDAIGKDTRNKLKSITLKYKPIAETLEVEFVPAHNTEWRIEGHALHFEVPPPNGTEIRLNYKKIPYGG